MRTRSACLILLAVGLASMFQPALAAPQKDAEGAHIRQTLARRSQVKEFPAVALSWDGQHLAWITAHGGEHALMLASWKGGNAHPVAIPGGCHEEGVRWAHHWNELAVLTRCKADPSSTQPIRGAIWVVDVNAGTAPRKVADLAGLAEGMQWSRDGKRIGFLYEPGATRSPYATASGNPRVGVIGDQDVRRGVAAVAAAGGTPEMLTPESLYVYEFRFSSIGNRIAYTAAQPPGGDNRGTAKLYTQDATPAATPKMIVDPSTAKGPLHGLQIALPRWSPDDARILFIGRLVGDRGVTGGDIYGVPESGGMPVDLTEGTKVTPSWFTFLGPRSLLVNQIASGRIQVTEYTLVGNHARQTRTWFTAVGMIGDGRAPLAVSLSSKRPRRIAYAQSSFDRPPAVHSGVLGTQPPPAVSSHDAGLKISSGKAR
ncbi:MAG TPA: hypothetical protein VJ862_08845 [Rhodanobacteraceae bacterium]|nr:hypothetical protein [Rhodanobacteraceae bacterium]